MNERIKLLAEQAEREVYPVTCLYKDEGAPRLNAQFEQKFAELIVRECVSIANGQFAAASGLDDRDCWTAVEIKKHFGVEE